MRRRKHVADYPARFFATSRRNILTHIQVYSVPNRRYLGPSERRLSGLQFLVQGGKWASKKPAHPVFSGIPLREDRRVRPARRTVPRADFPGCGQVFHHLSKGTHALELTIRWRKAILVGGHGICGRHDHFLGELRQDLQSVLFPFCAEAGNFLGFNALLADLRQNVARSQPQYEHQYRFHVLHECFSPGSKALDALSLYQLRYNLKSTLRQGLLIKNLSTFGC